ncbi:MAG: DUF488 domain-containing protein [Actinobacteria bacterium]|nr:DUF488 domain-containing protein [Actinomycetota bacterium]MCG2808472.1 DUF488 domain-containing protein [Coriobacteriia bacterium]
MEIYTIGFTKKSAEQFFGLLRRHGIERLVDIRLNNSSQLAGFTKARDLEFFLREILGASYVHEPRLAPTEEILGAYKHGGSWSEYEHAYMKLLRERQVESLLRRSDFEHRSVLLCSEPTTERCHRRLAAEYLSDAWGDVRRIDI